MAFVNPAAQFYAIPICLQLTASFSSPLPLLLRIDVAPAPLVVPCRDQPPPDPHQRECCLDALKLAFQRKWPFERSPASSDSPNTVLMPQTLQFTVVQFTPVFLDTSAAGCFGFFALMNLLFIPMIYFL